MAFRLIIYSTLSVHAIAADLVIPSIPTNPTHITLSMYILKPQLGIDEYSIQRVLSTGSHLTVEVNKHTKPEIFLPAFGYEEDHITIQKPAKEILTITAINQFHEHLPSIFLFENKRISSEVYYFIGPPSFERRVLLYEAPAAPIVNTSNRAEVSPDKVAITGFVITTPSWVIIRGIGPSMNLDEGYIKDPIITLHADQYLIDDSNDDLENSITNDNWQDTLRIDTLEYWQITPDFERESALVTYLNPGAYTVVLEGKGEIGTGLVEVYLAPYSLPLE